MADDNEKMEQDRKAWIKPQITKLLAGAAELGDISSNDAPSQFS